MFSIYAPIAVDGPLPSFFSASLAKQLYGKNGHNLSFLFRKLKKNKPIKNSADTFRSLLNQSEIRDKLTLAKGKNGIPSLGVHQFINGFYATSSVYINVIKPSLVSIDDVLFLDVKAFRSSLTKCEFSNFNLQDEQSDEFILAMLVLAYGLLQPDDASELVASLIEVNEGYRTQFILEDILPVKKTAAVTLIEEPLTTNQKMNESNCATLMLDEKINSLKKKKERNYVTKLSDFVSNLQEAKEIRVKIAGDVNARISAVQDSIDLESQAEAQYKAFTKRLREGLKVILADLESLASVSSSFSVAQSSYDDDQSIAQLVDSYNTLGFTLCEYFSFMAGIEECLVPHWGHSDFYVFPESISSIGELKLCLEKYCCNWITAVEQSQKLKKHFSFLSNTLEDCLSYAPAGSFDSLTVNDVVVLLSWIEQEPNRYILLPLVMRLLFEVAKGKTRTVCLEKLYYWAVKLQDDNEFLSPFALLIFLRPEDIQLCLKSNNAKLKRFVVLVTFLNSLSCNDSFFFNYVWNNSDWKKKECMGGNISEYCDILYKCYQANTLTLVHNMISKSVKVHDEKNCEINISDAKAVLVKKLLHCHTNMTGFFQRLRSKSHELYFKNLGKLIDSEQLLIAHELCERIAEENITGILYSNLSKDFIDKEKLAAKHKTSITKYVQELLDECNIFFELIQIRNISDQELDSLAIVYSKICKTSHNVSSFGSVAWCETLLRTNLRAYAGGTSRGKIYNRIATIDREFFSQSTQKKKITTLADYSSLGFPTLMRSWVAFAESEVSWRDILQDLLSCNLYGRSVTLYDALSILARDSYPEAALLYLEQNIDEAEQSEFIDIASKARKFLEHQKVLAEKFDSVAEFLEFNESIFSEALNEEERGRYLKFYEKFIELDRIPSQQEYENQDRVLDELTSGLNSLLEQNSGREERVALRDWLASANIKVKESSSVQELKKIILEEKYKNKERRQHIEALEGIAIEVSVPSPLSRYCEELMYRLDIPNLWPSAKISSDCATRINILNDISNKSWWPLFSQLNEYDPQYRRLEAVLKAILNNFYSHLVTFLTRNQEDQSNILNIILQKDSYLLKRFYGALEEQGLVETHIPEKNNISSYNDPIADYLAELRIKINQTIASKRFKPLAKSSMAQLVAAFSSGDFKKATIAAAKEYSYQQDVLNKNSEELDHVAALFAWSEWNSTKGQGEIEIREALALVVLERLAIARLMGGELVDVLACFSKLVPSMSDDAASPVRLLEKTFSKIVSSPSIELYDVLDYVLHIVDTGSLGKDLWEVFTGYKGKQQQARVDLLRMLYNSSQLSAVSGVFNHVAESKVKYLDAFCTLVKRASTTPSSQLRDAIRKNLKFIQSLAVPKPVIIFAESLVAELDFGLVEINVDVLDEILPTDFPNLFKLIVVVTPDVSDPPLSLDIQLDQCDFLLADFPDGKLAFSEELFFAATEKELLVRTNTTPSTCVVSGIVEGESVSGQKISQSFRKKVEVRFEKPNLISSEALAEIYEGFEGRPVSGDLFVGRESELVSIEKALITRDPGAVILYGIRRLGKTSLLEEMKRLWCRTHRATSHCLFIFVPVDILEIRDDKVLSYQFFKLILDSLLRDPKNKLVRKYLEERVEGRKELRRKLYSLASENDGSLLYWLIDLADLIKDIAEGECSTLIFVFDEFDKLMEAYRKQYENATNEIVNQLRRLATEIEGVGIILSGSDLMRPLVDRYRSAFFGSASVIKLDCFSSAKEFKHARRIVVPDRIQAYRKFSDDVVREIVRITGGHPLYLRLMGLTCAGLSTRERVSVGMVRKALVQLIQDGGAQLKISLPDINQLALQPTSSLLILHEKNRVCCEILLYIISLSTTLEQPLVNWKTLEEGLKIFSSTVDWHAQRDLLLEAQLIEESKKLWGIRFPLMAEAMRFQSRVRLDELQREMQKLLGGESYA